MQTDANTKLQTQFEDRAGVDRVKVQNRSDLAALVYTGCWHGAGRHRRLRYATCNVSSRGSFYVFGLVFSHQQRCATVIHGVALLHCLGVPAKQRQRAQLQHDQRADNPLPHCSVGAL